MTRKKGLYKDIVGEKYGKWTVLSFSHSVQKTEKRSTLYWNCISDDGELAIKSSIALRHYKNYEVEQARRVHKRKPREKKVKSHEEILEYQRQYREKRREYFREYYKKYYYKHLTLEQKLKRWLRT